MLFIVMKKNETNNKSLPNDLKSLRKELDLIHKQFDQMNSNLINMSNSTKISNINGVKKNKILDLKKHLHIALIEYKEKLRLEAENK